MLDVSDGKKINRNKSIDGSREPQRDSQASRNLNMPAKPGYVWSNQAALPMTIKSMHTKPRLIVKLAKVSHQVSMNRDISPQMAPTVLAEKMHSQEASFYRATESYRMMHDINSATLKKSPYKNDDKAPLLTISNGNVNTSAMVSRHHS